MSYRHMYSFPPPPPCPEGFIYTVQQGDTLWLISRKFSLSLDALIAANPQIKNPDLIFPGQRICVPFPPPPKCPEGFIYTVKEGDTLWFISRKFSLSLDALIAANPQIKNPDLIFPGQKICIPKKKPKPPELPPPPECPEGFIYTVQQGDTLFSIAGKFGIELDALIEANPQIEDPDEIFPGQEICVPFPPPPDCPDGVIYTVQEGDTLSSIADHFGVSVQAILDANPQIKDPNLIFAGQKICIP